MNTYQNTFASFGDAAPGEYESKRDYAVDLLKCEFWPIDHETDGVRYYRILETFNDTGNSNEIAWGKRLWDACECEQDEDELPYGEPREGLIDEDTLLDFIEEAIAEVLPDAIEEEV